MLNIVGTVIDKTIQVFRLLRKVPSPVVLQDKYGHFLKDRKRIHLCPLDVQDLQHGSGLIANACHRGQVLAG
jgi:hypothetical protein